MRGSVLIGERVHVRVAFAAVAAALCFCGCATDQRAWTRQDPWYNPPPEGSHVENDAATPVEWAQVKGGQRLQAAALLDASPLVELTPAQRVQFLDEPVGKPGDRIFLVRAVYTHWESGHFSVLTDGRDLVVNHGSFGTGAGPMGRWPLVVACPFVPRNVYVVCWVAR